MNQLTTAALIELGALRQRDVEREVDRRVSQCDGCTVEEVKRWTDEAYRNWRELWPNLNALFIPHAAVGLPEDKGEVA